MAQQARRSKSPKTKKTSAVARKVATSETHKAKQNGARKNGAKAAPASARRWSQDVTEHSDALDLRKGVFKLKDPKKIAASLKASAEHSRRRKAAPYRSALSMLIFYMNRGGRNLPVGRKRILQRAKRELRHQFGRD